VNRVLAGAVPLLMVTDPPYGVSYHPEWRHDAGLNDSDCVGKVQNDDRVDWTDAYALFPGDVVYAWHAGRFAGEVAQHLAAAGFGIRAQIVWRKPTFAISRGHYHWQHEPCWYAVRDGRTSKWAGDRSQSTVWDISNRFPDRSEHGTQKPIECMAKPMQNHGGAADAVYDGFLGSGTTLVAAEQLGRRCFGIEIDPRYCDVAIGRWQKLTGKDATLDGDGRTFAQIAAERGVTP
jgi:DNA modification methylase